MCTPFCFESPYFLNHAADVQLVLNVLIPHSVRKSTTHHDAKQTHSHVLSPYAIFVSFIHAADVQPVIIPYSVRNGAKDSRSSPQPVCNLRIF